jgi:hypothetical protein
MIAAVAVATQTPVLPQFLQPAGDFTAVVAPITRQIGIEHRRVASACSMFWKRAGL